MPPLSFPIRLLRWFGCRQCLPFGLRDRVLRLAADPDHLPEIPFVCEFFGMSYPGRLNSFVDWSVYFQGAYERGLLFFLRDCAIRLGGREAVFLDIGANVGQHTMFMAPWVGRVHAFEPWPEARRAIAEKVALNRLNNVEMHAVGLSDRAETLTYFAPATANGGTGSFLAGHNPSNRAAEALPLVRGDDYLAERHIGRIDLIKIDTEGFEPHVLAGIPQTLARHRPVVVFELSPAGGDEFAAPGNLAEAIAKPFGTDWMFHTLAGGPEHYRLEPLHAVADNGTVVAVPVEKAGLLPQAG